MNGSLSGKSALVVGGSRGIGRAIGAALSANDAEVTLLARDPVMLEAAATEAGADWVSADIGDDAQVEAAVAGIQSRLGGAPHMLVNCAGAFDLATLDRTDVAVLDRAYRVNLRGPFVMIRAFLPHMLERGSGIIVNIGSIAGRVAFPRNGAYSASKFGLRGLHEVLVAELAGSGVRATLIEPGGVDTELWDRFEPDRDPELPGRADMLSVADVADAVVFVSTRPPGVRLPLLQISRG